MPWLLSSPLDCASPSPCQRQCERTAFSFYCAVRERLPAWLLEDMRGMEVFCWDDGRPRAFRPSEALLYALVHDHQDYARVLLERYSVGALRAPRCSFCRARGGGAPHLAVAVRYDRVAILGMMVRALREREEPGERRRYLDDGGACAHAPDAGKSAVQLAVELSRPRCLLLLLAHGARPDAFDAALQRLAACAPAERARAQRCVDLLLLFLAEPPRPRCVREEPQRWRGLLGSRVFGWLRGVSPPPLLLQALRSLARSGPDQISTLPAFLQPQLGR
ncbi:ankyrin repeat domain-containing protein 9-like [Menidia menidia]